MLIEMLQAKLHRARVTACHLDYPGSLTVDTTLLAAAGLRVHQKVQVVNINNGSRLETYLIEGPADSGQIIVNGAAARLAQPGDLLIVIAYATCTPEEAEGWSPTVVVCDDDNRISAINRA